MDFEPSARTRELQERLGDFIRERREPDTPTGVGIRMFGLDSAGQRLHPRRCALDGHPGSHPANDTQETSFARRAVRKTRAAIRRAHVPRRPERRRRVGNREVFGHDANHAPVAAFHRDAPIDNLRIGAECLP